MNLERRGYSVRRQRAVAQRLEHAQLESGLEDLGRHEPEGEFGEAIQSLDEFGRLDRGTDSRHLTVTFCRSNGVCLRVVASRKGEIIRWTCQFDVQPARRSPSDPPVSARANG